VSVFLVLVKQKQQPKLQGSEATWTIVVITNTSNGLAAAVVPLRWVLGRKPFMWNV